MGQKVHPLGFRVGITKRHENTWFARFYKNGYSGAVLEDKFIKEKLMKLFPELLNPLLKKKNKDDENSRDLGRISEIKIERGLIPYEIGISIYGGNPEILKSAIDNLSVSENVKVNVEKNRKILLDLRSRVGDLVKTGRQTKEATSKISTNERKIGSFAGKNSKLSGKRWRKRQTLRERSVENSLKKVLVSLKGKRLERSLREENSGRSRRRGPGASMSQNRKKRTSFSPSRKEKKFISIFKERMNAKFLGRLKDELRYWNEKFKENEKMQLAPLGYTQKWNLNRLKALRNQPLIRLVKLGQELRNKALTKLERMEKDYFQFGMLTKMQTLSYYQLILFIKGLKRLILQVRKEGRSTTWMKGSSLTPSTRLGKGAVEKIEKNIISLSERSLRQKVENLDEECRKIKFIEFLSETVRQHRTKNLYLYLGTISNSRKSLKGIGEFTRNYSNFLFGIDLNSVRTGDKEEMRPQLESVISKILKKKNNKGEFQKGLPDIFLDGIDKQRQMHKDNISLTPKISFKFYSIKSAILETKASVVAETITDDLEKRKAFRSVIKVAKEKLMSSTGVKGVKIQVAGRLNGAEIARTEWVRSGRVPLQTLRADIDYSYRTASTIYGIIGVKVWIYKGPAKFLKGI